MAMRWPRTIPLEKDIQAGIARDLRLMGFAVTTFSQARPSKQTPGIPDLLALHPVWRLVLWIEVKRPKHGRVSAEQEAWHDVARRSGMTVVVACGTSDVLAALVALGAPIQVQGA